MSASIECVADGILTSLVREQLTRIYEETDLVICGSLGRIAVMGGEPDYWYRHNGIIRDIDVFDPLRTSCPAKIKDIDHSPLPFDKFGFRWLKIEDDIATVSLPRDSDINVQMPADMFKPVTNTLLGVPVRTFLPDIVLGLNKVVPYDRIRQRKRTESFEKWVTALPEHDPELLVPFNELELLIRTRCPEYVRLLTLKDYASFLPEPVQILLKKAYKKGVFSRIV